MFETVEAGLESLYNSIISIGETVFSIGEAFIQCGKYLVYIITTALDFLIHIPVYCAWLPTEAIVIFVVLFSIVIYLKVVSTAMSLFGGAG